VALLSKVWEYYHLVSPSVFSIVSLTQVTDR